ncbi:hypothetical protein [Paraburkholderia sp. BCC1876]|uniref:hypothetical protein n=1 Tax=Paraburkholderia sp. BCC1876 TaxID=2676303 RepID=UPI00159293C2|nr:hypothetical protein [Paraburkholderia sp. BCC1876]
MTKRAYLVGNEDHDVISVHFDVTASSEDAARAAAKDLLAAMNVDDCEITKDADNVSDDGEPHFLLQAKGCGVESATFCGHAKDEAHMREQVREFIAWLDTSEIVLIDVMDL